MPPYISVTTDRRGRWFAAMFNRGQIIDRLESSHNLRRDALTDAREWAKDEGLRFETGNP